jgi:uncharacterized protein YndB with AHSA1/START domain
MLTVLKWLFYLIAAIALIIVGGSFLLPAQAVVTRSIEIAAPPDKVFAIVGDLRRFNEFSPWADLDPNIKYTFEGPESGIGQKMNWTSENPDVGSGSQTITKYEPPNFVETQLDFGIRGKPVASFDLVPSASGTSVTWTFSSNLEGIPAKWFGLMFDRWIGPDYEKGLFKLKTVAEAPAPEPAAPEPATSEPAAPEPTVPAAPSPEQPAPEPAQPAPAEPTAPAAPEQPAQ